MDIFPAIDIRNGRVVRLSRGEPDAETVYHSDPVALAERFVWQGARWIHVVDLDRAFGDGENIDVIDRIITRVGSHVRIQVGGGLRTLAHIATALDSMAARLVLGTAAVEQPALLAEAVRLAGAARLAVALDTRDGKVAHHGWTATSQLDAGDLTRRVAALGIRTVVYTDIGRDGMLGGPDCEGAVSVQQHGVEVIISGGVGSLDDIRRAKKHRLAGIIVGRALYEERVSLPEALEVASAPVGMDP